jgi:hypothetical protein
MSTVFSPLSIEKIDEGEFLDDVNAELLRVQDHMERHRQLYGSDSEKAKATLTISVDLVIVEPDDGAYMIKAKVAHKLPGRPATTSMALSGETQEGRPAVLVRSSGSDADDPRQGKMFTRAGDAIEAAKADDDEEYEDM